MEQTIFIINGTKFFFKIKKDTALWPNEFVENERSGSNRRCILGNTGDYNENAQQLTMFLNAQNYQIDHRKDDDIYYFYPAISGYYCFYDANNGYIDSEVYDIYGQELNITQDAYYLSADNKYYIKIYHSYLYNSNNSCDPLYYDIPISYTISVSID